jgi:predicted RND superfamily exporter protein
MANRRPIGVKQPLYDMTEKMIADFVADAPKGLTHMGQSFGHQGWVWMETEKALVAGLMNGLAICFPIAFVVLAVATRNFILSIIATLSIGFIVASVLGSVKLFYGWDLGIAETIAGIIVIGFSVDYVVHMGHMYIEAAEKSGAMTREKRFFYAASKMGSTVMAGAITTAGSGAFMFVCQMRFFYKMAILITMTIGYSFVFSFGFFMAFLVIAGPEYDESNLGLPCGLSLVKEAEHIMNERKKGMMQLRSARGLAGDAKAAGLMEGGDGGEPKKTTTAEENDGELNGDEIRGWKANTAKKEERARI